MYIVFADWTPQDWLILLGGLAVFLERAGAWRINYTRERDKLAREAVVAAKVEQVSEKADAAVAHSEKATAAVAAQSSLIEEATTALVQGQNTIAAKIDVVHDMTNGVNEKIAAANLAFGVPEDRDAHK